MLFPVSMPKAKSKYAACSSETYLLSRCLHCCLLVSAQVTLYEQAALSETLRPAAGAGIQCWFFALCVSAPAGWDKLL